MENLAHHHFILWHLCGVDVWRSLVLHDGRLTKPLKSEPQVWGRILIECPVKQISKLVNELCLIDRRLLLKD